MTNRKKQKNYFSFSNFWRETFGNETYINENERVSGSTNAIIIIVLIVVAVVGSVFLLKK